MIGAASRCTLIYTVAGKGTLETSNVKYAICEVVHGCKSVLLQYP